MTKIMDIIKSDLLISIAGGMAIGFGAVNFYQPISDSISPTYGETRMISVEQSAVNNYQEQGVDPISQRKHTL